MRVTKRNSVYRYDSIAYKRTVKILKDNKLTGFCFQCKKDFKKGDMLFSRTTRPNRRFYHLKCWEALFQ